MSKELAIWIALLLTSLYDLLLESKSFWDSKYPLSWYPKLLLNLLTMFDKISFTFILELYILYIRFFTSWVFPKFIFNLPDSKFSTKISKAVCNFSADIIESL